MRLKEWMQNNQQLYQVVRAKYPTYFEYVENRYANYQLKYEDNDVFYALLTSFILENSKELTKIENIKNLQFEADKLGNINKTVESDAANFSGENSVNYVGMNVEGTFNKNATTSTNQTDRTRTSTNTNLLAELIKLNNSSLINQFLHLNKEFETLLILFVSI